MTSLTLLSTFLALQGATAPKAPETVLSPESLPIGRSGKVTVVPGQIVDTRTGKVVTAEDIAKACAGKKFLYVGENHANKPHQQLEADLVLALVAQSRRPAVGVEMFTRPKQDVLDTWSTGKVSEVDFLEKSEWKTQWGFAYDFYRPLFEAVKQNQLPVVALNVPRDWVRITGKGGYAALPMTARLQLPAEMSLTNKNHRMVFDSLMGGHQMGPSMENVYAAQVLWDEGMADTALKYLAVRPPQAKDIFVVVAGSGHIMYEQGINYRVAKRRGGNGITVVMTQSDKPIEVSRGIGDFVFVSKP